VQKESYRDGYKRAGLGSLKEKLDLEIESYGMPSSQRGEIKQEIKKAQEAANREVARVGGAN
jgi:hypothetical protein